LLLPLVPLYAGAMAAKRWLYDRGVLSPKRLPHPVISVGSLSAGGAGKTPVVLMLAELLERADYEVRILSRGYGRSGKSIERVDPDGDAAHFGDEPLLMARRLREASIGATVASLRASVYVGADRYQAGRLAGQGDAAATRAVYLLDDGFQHWRLARDIDVVLLTRQDMDDRLLPAGDLREPRTALRRADIVVLRSEESGVQEWVQEHTKAARAGSSSPVWVVQRRLQFADGVVLPARPVVFCGVARPQGFLNMIEEAGIAPAAVAPFRDHHPYAARDVDRLIAVAQQHDANGFVTTEKDAVKLSPAMLERLNSIGPVVVARLVVELGDEEAAVAGLVSMLAAKRLGRA
jgi:tetraacyldisaccharide 4'-kinase